MNFDEAYYERFYFDPRTAVTTRAQVQAWAALMGACMRYLDLPVRRILDAGCGVGALKKPLSREFREASYLGLEVSDYLCRRFGWRKGRIEDFRSRSRFDLVICNDVLQYLDDAEARRAIRNLDAACRGALWFGALTREDWESNCDRSGTDRTPHLRPAGWYRRELRRYFVPIGLGMWVHHRTPVALWELEQA